MFQSSIGDARNKCSKVELPLEIESVDFLFWAAEAKWTLRTKLRIIKRLTKGRCCCFLEKGESKLHHQETSHLIFKMRDLPNTNLQPLMCQDSESTNTLDVPFCLLKILYLQSSRKEGFIIRTKKAGKGFFPWLRRKDPYKELFFCFGAPREKVRKFWGRFRPSFKGCKIL